MMSTKDRVSGAAENVRPYVERALRDRELRDNVRNAYTSARSVYEELVGRHGVSDAATKLASDTKVQDELRHAIHELRQAAGRVKTVQERGPEPVRAARNMLVLVAGVAIGLLFNPLTGPPLRRLIARKLFGKSNGFVYRDSNGTGA